MNVAVAALATLLLISGTASAQSVSVAFDDGTVTLSARNAPLRAILAEWARVGGSTIVNAERVTGGPLTLELQGVSEREALGVLLRNVSGYIAAPRQARADGASSIDRILILPTSAPVAAAPSRPANSPPPIVFVPGDPDEDPITDIPPDGFPRTVPSNASQDIQEQLREAAARAEAARQEAEDAENPNEEPASSRSGRSGRSRNSPFGNIQGSSQPGVITPAPDEDSDDDPDR